MFPSFKTNPLNAPKYQLNFSGTIKQPVVPVAPVVKPVVKPVVNVPPNVNAIHYFLTK